MYSSLRQEAWSFRNLMLMTTEDDTKYTMMTLIIIWILGMMSIV
jgi:hypothetical protein